MSIFGRKKRKRKYETQRLEAREQAMLKPESKDGFIIDNRTDPRASKR